MKKEAQNGGGSTVEPLRERETGRNCQRGTIGDGSRTRANKQANDRLTMEGTATAEPAEAASLTAEGAIGSIINIAVRARSIDDGTVGQNCVLFQERKKAARRLEIDLIRLDWPRAKRGGRKRPGDTRCNDSHQ